MYLFVEHYEMEEVIQEETLMRAFQRWRTVSYTHLDVYKRQVIPGVPFIL